MTDYKKETKKRIDAYPLLKKKLDRDKSSSLIDAETIAEVVILEEAFDLVKDDYCAPALFRNEGKTDEDFAEMLNCDVSTVRRRRRGMLERISIFLYGAEAMDIKKSLRQQPKEKTNM